MTTQVEMRPWKIMMKSLMMPVRNLARKRAQEKISLIIWNSKIIKVNQGNRDYEARPELDQYENNGLDDQEDYEDMDFNTRRQAEKELDMQAKTRVRGRERVPGAFLDDDDEGQLSDEQLNREMRYESMRRMREEEG